jgi:hypothetical protein
MRLISVFARTSSLLLALSSPALTLSEAFPGLGGSAGAIDDIGTLKLGEEDPFERMDLGRRVKGFGQHFGVSNFDYFAWMVNSNFIDVVFTEFEDQESLTEAHFDFLVGLEAEDKIEEIAEKTTVPETQVKQAVVGILISEAMNEVYNNRHQRTEEVIEEIVEKIVQRNSSVDAVGLRALADQAIKILRNDFADSDSDDGEDHLLSPHA